MRVEIRKTIIGMPTLTRLTLWLLGGCLCGSCWAGPAMVDYQIGEDCNSQFAGALRCGYWFVAIEGRLVFEDSRRIQVPVKNAKFFEGYFDGSKFEGELIRRKARVNRRGQFSARVPISYSSYDVCLNGKIVEKETFGTKHYLVRATGCEALVILVQKEWEPQTFQLVCPGRS